MVCIAQGELERADALLATASGDADQAPALASRLLLAAHVERILAGGVPSEALALLDDLIEGTTNGGAGGTAVPHLHHLRGRILVAAGRLAAAAVELEGTRDAVRAQGNIYVAGTTYAADFPTVDAVQDTRAGQDTVADGFLAKIASDGASLLFSTYLGGAQHDELRTLQVDAQGNAYVAGFSGLVGRFALLR